MTAPTLVVCDNDILLKLAACDLLEAFPAAMNCVRDDLRVLPSAPRQIPHILKNRSIPHTDAQLKRTIEFIRSCAKVGDAHEDEHMLLNAVEGIDVGEAVLIASTHSMEDFIIATGDKRCLIALAESKKCAAIRSRIAGRVVCLEQVILRLIDSMGFEAVKAKVLPAFECDAALDAAFGSGALSNEEAVIDALSRYIRNLRDATGSLLSDL